MIRNYLKIAIRKAIRDRAYSIINLLGLAIGLASFLFITKYVDFERKIDHFHKYHRQIYRLHTDLKWHDVDESFPQTAPAVGTAIVENFPEVASVTRILPYMSDQVVKINDKLFYENQVMAVDSNFLEVFTFNLKEGNSKELFNEPNEVVLSEAYAHKYFGDKNAIDQLIEINDKSYKVSGIIENAPANSHIQYNLLLSNLSDEDLRYFEWSWIWCNLVTYVKLNPQTSPELLEAKFPDLVRNNAGYAIERLTGKSIDAFFEKGNQLGYLLEPLSEIYYSQYNPLGSSGSRTFIYIFSIVAFTILLLASINYTNLTTARSLKRAREIGLRKVVGTTKYQLYLQFLIESVLFSLASTVIAVFIYEVINNLMVNYFDIKWNLSLLANFHFVWFILGLALIVGIISGLYPAFYLSSFNPARSLKGLQHKGQAKSPMRNLLIVFQFLISFCIIIFTFTVNSQIHFLRNRDLGFDKENLIVISNIGQLQSKNVFKEQVNKGQAIISSTLSSHVPSSSAHGELFRKMEGEQDDFISNMIDADHDFITTFGLKINTGQNFTSLDLNNNSPKILVNQQAQKSLQLEDPLGYRIRSLDDGRVLEIGGVIDDFDYFISQAEMNPMIIRPYLKESSDNIIHYLTVKIASDNLLSTIEEIEDLWNSQETGIPFEFRFYDQIFNDIYIKEIRLGNLLSIFSGLAITIAILGLIGLISFHTEQLTKSIGIRKVFGATVPNILGLITKDFAKLFIIAFVIAIPIANYAIEDWLETFVNRININPWLFAIPGAVVLAIALSTIWIQSFKSASANPVDAIRNE